jgi:hypothetical protein
MADVALAVKAAVALVVVPPDGILEVVARYVLVL